MLCWTAGTHSEVVEGECLMKTPQYQLQSIDQHQVPVMITYTSSNENQFSLNPIHIYTAILPFHYSSRQLPRCA